MGFGKQGAGQILRNQTSIALGALANKAGILVTTKLGIAEDFRMLKTEVIADISGLTAGQGNNLVLVLADGDLTLPEVEAQLDLAGPINPSDTPTEEVAMRYCNEIAVAKSMGVADTAVMFHDRETGGPFIVAKPRWSFHKVASWNWIIYNRGASITTGATVRVVEKSYGVWLE